MVERAPCLGAATAALILFFASSAQAGGPLPKESIGATIEKNHAACVESISRDKGSLFWLAAISIVGTLVAGGAAAAAPFVSKAKTRKIAAVLGLAGAMMGVLPRLLPKEEDIRKRLELADRHLIIGEKVRDQLLIIDAADPLLSGWISNRFLECKADHPEPVPPLPAGMLANQPPTTPATILPDTPRTNG